MKNSAPKLYREHPGQRFRVIRLGDVEYGRAIQSLVLVCTDVGIIDSATQTIYLAKRASKPNSGRWWFVGGRTFPGESEHRSIKRCFRRETGLNIALRRFRFVCINRYFWADRAQSPQEVGCDSLCYTMSVELTLTEIMSVRLDTHEYEGGLRPFKYSELLHTPNIGEPVIDFYQRVFGVK